MVEVGETRGGMQLSFFQLDDPVLCQIRDEILNLDVNNLTPLEALNKLNDIKADSERKVIFTYREKTWISGLVGFFAQVLKLHG